MNKTIHIISFDVPFPANYGGVIDVYYKLLALKNQGIKIHLHCFNYGRKSSVALENLCERVFYYERKTGFFSNLSFLPYTVRSRRSKALEKNLLADDFPILFEVLHTCYLLNDPRFKNRKKIYRHSNIEHDYYSELSKSERNFLKRIYLRIEAWKLKRFEKILSHANLILAVNQKDTGYFEKVYPNVRSEYLPSFHPNSELKIEPGTGDFILFHGNLGVSENYNAAAWLINNVFPNIKYSCVIAGLNPPPFLSALIKPYPNITLIASPGESEMNHLVTQAQVHVLYTAQPTGLKLKLLNVLFNGRFVVCNRHMISGTGIKENDSLLIACTSEEFVDGIKTVMMKDFSEGFLSERKIAVSNFDNLANIKKLIDLVF